MAHPLKIHVRAPNRSVAFHTIYVARCGRIVPKDRCKKRFPREKRDPRYCKYCLDDRPGV